MITQPDRNGGRLLPDLYCPVGTFQHGRRTVINPRVMCVVSKADNSIFLIRRRDRGQTGQDRADEAVILHRRHIVVYLEGGQVTFGVQADLDIRKGGT